MKSFKEWIEDKKGYKRKEDYCKKCGEHLPGKLNKNNVCRACERTFERWQGGTEEERQEKRKERY